MIARDWLEDLYLKSINKVAPDLEYTHENLGKISEIIKNTFPKIVEVFTKSMKTQSKTILRWRRNEISRFKKNVLRRWGVAFDQYEVFISYNLEYGEIISESVRKVNKSDVKFETLLRLHARACQIAYEILELMQGGFADGAFARWRSLYEISIISNFLLDRPIELSKRYLDYYFVESYFEMLEYQKNYEKLGFDPLKLEEVQQLESNISELSIKYGSDFIKPYGWLGEYLPKQKWNFVGIEGTTDLKHFHTYYKFANNYIHSGPKAFIYKLGTYGQNKVMLAGPSNYGFADPAQNAAFSLFQVTLALSTFEDYLGDSLFLQIGNNMLEKLYQEFLRIQIQIEDEEDKINNIP